MNEASINAPAAKPEEETTFEYDPAYINSLRELYVMGRLWVASLVWSMGYCAIFAYRSPDANEPVTIIWGVPSWVMWGIALPWIVSSVATIWFALFYIREDDADLLAAEASLENCSRKSEGDVL